MPQLLVFVLAAVLLHQFGVVERLTPEWRTERWIGAIASFAICLALVTPFLDHFVDRRFDARSPWVPGLVMGLAGTLPFLLSNGIGRTYLDRTVALDRVEAFLASAR